MGTHILWGGLGLLVVAAYVGYAFSLGHTPYWAGGALIVFAAVVSWPFFSEYSALNRGFKFTEGDFRTDEKKLLESAGGQEVIAPSDQKRGWRAWRRYGPSRLGYRLLLIIGTIFIIIDFYLLIIS